MYPKVRAELHPIYLRDGAIWTSAGMTAGIDLALALVEDDHGRRLSLAVAKNLVVFLRRSGGQAQFSSALAAQTRLGTVAPNSRLAELPAWIVNNLNADLSVDGLAKMVGMTPRTFARNFAKCHGGTPAKLVEDLRVEAACRHLEDSEAGIKRIRLCVWIWRRRTHAEDIFASPGRSARGLPRSVPVVAEQRLSLVSDYLTKLSKPTRTRQPSKSKARIK
jgi:transcriptional regulator GlxA family with amidase domain